MKTLFLPVFGSVLGAALLAGCKRDAPTPPRAPVDSYAHIKVRVTSDVALPEKAQQITFVPNSVAPWLGQIILLSKDGQLYNIRPDDARALPISEAPHRDIYGLTREKAAGMFLAVSDKGQIKAYVETDDAGHFKPVIVSTSSDLAVKSFCTGGDPLTGRAAFIDSSGNIQTYQITDISDDGLTIDGEKTVQKAGGSTACAYQDDGTVLLADVKSEGLPFAHFVTVTMGGKPYHMGRLQGTQLAGLSSTALPLILDIEDGLSIYGADKITAMSATNHPFGSTYSGGLVAASDAREPRLLLISLDFLQSRVEIAAVKSAQ